MRTGDDLFRQVNPQLAFALHDNSLVRGFYSKHWGWWYLSIGEGFLLLAIAAEVTNRARLLHTVMRLIIAVGFAVLAALQFRYGK